MQPPPLLQAEAFAGESSTAQSHLLRGPLRYYHYNVDGSNDSGWGCGYRTVQSILSWMSPESPPPSIAELQHILAQASGAEASATAWIGVPDAVVLLDELKEAAVEVLPLKSGRDMESQMSKLAAHFDAGGGPLMIGGGRDVYSKTVIGVRSHPRSELLILDPHYVGGASLAGEVEALRAGGWAAWRPVGILDATSFYNIALPRPLPPSSGAAASRSGVRASRPKPANPEQIWDFEVVESGFDGES